MAQQFEVSFASHLLNLSQRNTILGGHRNWCLTRQQSRIHHWNAPRQQTLNGQSGKYQYTASILMPCDPKGNHAHATLAMKRNQAHSYSHCPTDGASGNSFPALPQCPSLVMGEGCGSWRRGPTCFSGRCESSSSIVRLQTC